MVHHRMTRVPADADPAVATPIEDYLNEVIARLPGRRRAAAAAIGELRDGLHDAIDAYRGVGLDQPAAVQAAIAESGPPEVIAIAYRPVVANLHGRRTGRTLLATGPLVGLLWLLALAPRRSPAALLHTVPALGVVLMLGVAAALVAAAPPGRAAHWIPFCIAQPRNAATLCCTVAIAIDATVLTLAATQLTSLIAPPQWPVTLAAAIASTARLTYTQHAARTGLRTTP
jgi:hypothetical protein